MTMWRVTVKPIENVNAWRTFIEQEIIAIGWPDRRWDNNRYVITFKRIQIDDWVVAHVPSSHGGDNCLALGVGRVKGPYTEIGKAEIPTNDQWSGKFRRQYSVNWTLGHHYLRDVLKIFRPTVTRLKSEEEEKILKLFEIV